MSFIANVDKSRFRASWIPASVLLLGSVSLTLLVGANWAHERLVAVDMLRLDAHVEIQLAVSTTHLWLEEYVSGDDVELANISMSLKHAETLFRTLALGGYLDGIDVELPALSPELGSGDALLMQEHLKRFAELSQRRQTAFESGQEAGIGSLLDVEYDSVFNDLLDSSNRVEQTIRVHLADNIRRARLMFQTMLLVWGVFLALVAAGLWTHEVRRRRTALQLARTEAQLFHSQKMDAVGRLASGITHDINNYLAAITTNCELVQMRAEPDGPVAAKMDVILRVVAKASTLIDRLLAFTRQKPRQTEIVDLNQLITGLEVIARQLAGKNTDFQFNLQQDLWTTEMDPAQVEQIVMNLVVNACQAMPDGGTLTIETSNAVLNKDFAAGHTIVTPGEYVLLCVSDTGVGIPIEIQGKIFEPFFTTKDPLTNTGLGLSTVYGLVNQNRGYISLYSEPPSGTTFKIYLPGTPSVAAQKPLRSTRQYVEKSGSEGVLFVEDNDDFRVSIQAMLEELGYRVFTVKNGKEALSMFADNRSRIDLVITDVIMPEMGGKELIETMRAQGDDVPVIFISGYSENVTLSEGLLHGKISLLQKPFSTNSLANNIRKTLGGASAPGR